MSVTVVSASAGTGKTHRLAREVIEALTDDGPALHVGELLAVTYTERARDELVSRLRRALIDAGRPGDAHRLPEALVGTVHAVCLRLLTEFSLEAGGPPALRVLPGETSAWVGEALEAALPSDLLETLGRLGRKLQIRWDARGPRSNWLSTVTDVMNLARQNRIAPEQLPGMAERSTAGLLRLFPPEREDAARLEGDFRGALETAIEALARAKPTKTTDKAASDLQRIHRELLERPAELPWVDWIRAGQVKPAKDGLPAIAPLVPLARRVLGHPALRTELAELIAAIYRAARVGIEAYRAWKDERNVVDYEDMIERALHLLERNPAVERELAERSRLVTVDEFQDTTPLQLALFLRLHRLGARSVWVGDRKQCIFEYAGADPALLDAAASWSRRTGGRTETLRENRRSRPELVRAVSALFSAAFERFGLPREEVEVEPARDESSSTPDLPPFGVWRFDKQHGDWVAIARGIRRLLDPAARPRIADRLTGKLRPLAAGDVGVLVRTNEHAKKLARALHDEGLQAATAQDGLMSTPEGTALDAALHWLLDEHDRLSAAILDALFEFGGQAPDDWLRGQLTAAEAPAQGWRAALGEVRAELAELSPAQLVDQVIGRLDLPQRCARWPSPHQRVGNLDALRAAAARFESTARERTEPATLAGLIRYLGELRKEPFLRDGAVFVERTADDQHVSSGVDAEAVTISTYHRAKGLEWPVVVLASLDDEERAPLFDVQPESDRAELDAEDPLAGRWIRYWPSPFGDADSRLRDLVAATDEGRRVAEREAHERVRLLYVGFTRARDHLVIAARYQKGEPKVRWLDSLSAVGGAGLLRLPLAEHEGMDALRVAHVTAPAQVWRLDGESQERSPPRAQAAWWPRPRQAPEFAPYLLRPSAQESGAAARTTEVARLKAAVEAAYQDGDEGWDRVGDAVHRFLACDDVGAPRSRRLELATRIAAGFGVLDKLRPETVVDEADALYAFAASRWPGARWRRELPISAETGAPATRINGTIDLLLECQGRLVVIDHKTFPAPTEPAWRKAAKEHAPQLGLYARALRAIRGDLPVECWIHLPIPGAMVALEARR